jgi:hypothetical protein
VAKQNIKTFRISNFKGGMNTQSEDNNVFTLDPNGKLGAAFTQVSTEFRNLDNWLPLNRGGISKVPGNTEFFDSAVSSNITGLYRYTKSNGTSLFLFSQGTKVYKVVAGVKTDIGATIANGAYTHFETAYDTLIICDGSSAPQKFDGTTVANLGGSPPSGARQALFYQNRLWMFSSTSNQSLLYYSEGGDIEDGYASNFVSCDTNDGQKITGICKFFIPGNLEPVIIVAKERSIGTITGTGVIGDPFTFTKIAFDIGVPGFRQLVQYGQDVGFLTPQGVTTYATTLQNVNVKRQLLSEKITDQFTSLSASNLPLAFSWYDWKRNIVRIAVAAGNASLPNTIWTFDPIEGGWYKQTGFTLTCAFTDTDGTVYFGNNAGKIFTFDSTTSSYDGTAITAVAQTGYIDFFEPQYYKRLRNVTITIRGDGQYNLIVTAQKDFGVNGGSSHSVEIDTANSSWNGGFWTNDGSVYRWGSTSLVTKPFYPKGIFKNIAFTLTQSGVDQPLDIVDMTFEVEYLTQY